MNPKLEAARRAVEEKKRELRTLTTDALNNDLLASERRALEKRVQAVEADLTVLEEKADKLEAYAGARALIPQDPGTASSSATARGSLRSESTYRPDRREFSFFTDLVTASNNPLAIERLQANQREQLDLMEPEVRAVTTQSGSGGGFVPPAYLGDLWAALPRATRPFAASIPNRPLMETGMTLSVPRVTTGSTVSVQTSQNTSIGTQDVVSTTLSVPVITVAGYVDLSVQALERTAPGLDMVIFSDLRAAYDSTLDTQLLSGAGTTEHLGIRNVSSINTSTYTASTPTGAALLPKVYDCIQLIGSNRYRNANLVVLHPRRAAWLGKELSSTVPLFQQGSLVQAVGQQDAGFVTSFAGLETCIDPNIATNYSVGGNTNEDEIYLVYTDDLVLYEGVPVVEVFRDVLSSTMGARLRLYSYSAFVSGRQPKAIAKLAGSGLAVPSF